MTCPKCGGPLEAELEQTGGCHGHHGEDSRCYCDSPDAHIIFRCYAKIEHALKNHKKRITSCGYTIKPGPLSDQYSIAR